MASKIDADHKWDTTGTVVGYKEMNAIGVRAERSS